MDRYDVVIVGGGPGGSTVGSFLRRYAPQVRVLIVERERFPREHVGESQLPEIGRILHEMGAWERIESAGFPIKIGATYRWGASPELWDFEFVPPGEFPDAPRPSPYAGVRTRTALQVERARYDEILLRYAQELGCDVREGVAVRSVSHADDEINELHLSDGSTVRASWFVDASGNAAVLRRALGVPVDCPTALKNIAVWDYWDNAAWAVSIGVGGTRVQVMSVGYGWLWFIPLGPTRTSIGLVVPAVYYKASGRTPEELYLDALGRSDRISKLIAKATRSGEVRTTNDWSFLADRTTGKNWLLVGEAAGFADPILAAGMTLTHVSGREAAYTLKAILTKEHERDWLLWHYNRNQRARIRQHMRFAEFWYAANGQFTDLQEHCRTIAASAGLTLSPQKAWAWLAQGGFTNDIIGQVAVAGFDLGSAVNVTQRFLDADLPLRINGRNMFKLHIQGAIEDRVPAYIDGKTYAIPCLIRGEQRLPIVGLYELVIRGIERTPRIDQLLEIWRATLSRQLPANQVEFAVQKTLEILEVLVQEGWVVSGHNPALPILDMKIPREGRYFHANSDGK